MMQKSVVSMLLAVVLLLGSAAVFSGLDVSGRNARYHQHLEEPSEADLGVCAVCGGEAWLCTHLPLIRISTGGQKIPGHPVEGEDGLRIGYETAEDGSEEILVTVETVEERGAYHHAADPATVTASALFRIRGNSSRWFSKSSYKITTVDPADPEKDVKTGLLGMAAGEEWALYGPFLDKTLIRNYMWMNIAGIVMPDWTPNVRFCEVLIDGEYRGLYVLMELPEVQENRLNLTKYKEGDLAPSYAVRIEPVVDEERSIDNFTFYTYRMEPGSRLELIYPGRKHRSERVLQYAATDFCAVERMLYAADAEAWKAEIDMDSFVRFYILEEFLGVNDTFSASTYFYRDARGKLAVGPVWDFNNALDNFFTPLSAEEFLLSQRGWFGQMMRDEDFVEAVIRTYRSLRKNALSDEYLTDYVSGTLNWLGSAADRNFAVWGWSFDPEQLSAHEYRRPEEGAEQSLYALNPDSQGEAVEWMVEYMRERAAWMDEHIDSLRQYCHASRNLDN